MARFSDDELGDIKRRIDLVALVRSKGIELKPHGGGHFAGRCPFHDDKTPSFIVTPGKNLFHCMGCGAGGSVIDFVMKHEGLSFRHAVELLKSNQLSALCGPVNGGPVKKSRLPRLDSPLTPDADDQAALRQVLDYYQARLKENPAALAYLEKRGLKNDEAIATFKLGFADRTLGLRLPPKTRKDGEAIRTRLERLGVYRESGREHFNGCLVFPIIADNGDVTEIYGRKIGDQSHGLPTHLYLPGPHGGLWNPACLRSKEIILCEAIIDALTFWCAGFRHVTAAYGVEGFTQEMEDAIVAAGVRVVWIAFDRDEAGDRGAEKVSARLMARGVECRRVLFPHDHDANEYALKVRPADKSLGVLLNAAQWMGKVSAHVAPAPVLSSLVAAKSLAALESAPEVKPTSNEAATSASASAAKEKTIEANPPAAPSLVPNGEHWFLTLDGREYRVGGLEKTLGSGALKIALRLKVGDRFHLDAIDLARDPERRRFIERAAEETGLHADLLKRDLGRLLLAVETAQAELARPAKAGPSIVALTPEERDAALAFLRNPNLWDLIPEHAALCGIAGERVNVRVGYLGAVSRLLDRPLMIIIQSSSAAGKTTLMDAILAFIPPERRIKYSAMTGQALFYMGGTDLAHKILAIVEEEGAEKASYALKLLQSEGELRIASTGKDPHTGRMETQEYHLQGPVMIFLTTTNHTINEELQNRGLILTVDESREQTERIHALQREARTEAGLERKGRRDELLALHRAAQSLLQPLPVFNPYSTRLRFLSDRLRTRRDHEKYLLLIDSLALLFQHQRGRKVIAGLDDIARANELAHEVLGRGLDDMPPQTRRLLDLIERMVVEKCSATKIERTDARFRARHLREFTGWGHSQLHVHLQRLVELEYLIPHRADHGQGIVYELLYDGGGKNGAKFLPGLIDVEKLRTYDAQRPGVNGECPAPVRPQSGPVLGGVRPGKNGDSSYENGATEAKRDENSQLEGRAVCAS
jgi:DNA primase